MSRVDFKNKIYFEIILFIEDEYGGLTEITMPVSQLWIPDIVLQVYKDIGIPEDLFLSFLGHSARPENTL